IAIGRSVGLQLTRVGSMFEPAAGRAVTVVDGDGRVLPAMRGFDHFPGGSG
ncbi:MAG: hypothetical protein JNM90_02095, partial [Burkholderiales bacterium]|nr:hypothetical protein [Burkholderiales bacterium]